MQKLAPKAGLPNRGKRCAHEIWGYFLIQNFKPFALANWFSKKIPKIFSSKFEAKNYPTESSGICVYLNYFSFITSTTKN